MPKQSPAVPAASSLASDPILDSDRLDALGRYVALRDWSFAVVDLMELAGQSLTSRGQSPLPESSLFWKLPLLPSSFEHQRRQMTDGAMGALLVVDRKPLFRDDSRLVE